MIITKRKLRKKLKDLINLQKSNTERWNPRMSKAKKIAWAKRHERIKANIDFIKELLG